MGSICWAGYFQGSLYVVELEKEVSSRVVPYDPDLKCDYCGNIGGSDYMGDNICDSCLYSYQGRDGTLNCFYADPPTFREFIQGLFEWIKIEVTGMGK